MKLKEYIDKAKTFAIYDKDKEIDYITLGLIEETGEVCGVYKKVIRDNNSDWDDNRKNKLLYELGDVLWYTAMFINHYKLDIDSIENYEFEDMNIIRHFFALPYAASQISLWLINDDESHTIATSSLKVIFANTRTIAEEFGFTIEEVMDSNIAKLSKRKKENKIHGEGSDR